MLATLGQLTQILASDSHYLMSYLIATFGTSWAAGLGLPELLGSLGHLETLNSVPNRCSFCCLNNKRDKQNLLVHLFRDQGTLSQKNLGCHLLPGSSGWFAFAGKKGQGWLFHCQTNVFCIKWTGIVGSAAGKARFCVTNGGP